MVTDILLELAVILLATKCMGMLMRKLGLPQVVGAVIAGLLIGPAIWGQFGWWSPIDFSRNDNPESSQFFFKAVSEIGVVMILFSAGLETNLKDLKKCGLTSFLVAMGGVIVPLIFGFLITVPFLPGGFSALSDPMVTLEAVFVGVILTATSVGITVECLKEMGRLKGKLGTVILSAAIIDDILGIIVLSIVISFKNPSADGFVPGAMNPALWTVLKMLMFFVLAIGVGIGLNYLFKYLIKKFSHTRRIPIFALIVCFVYAYCAEKLFGVADITGAYLAGIILSNLHDTSYIDRKIDTNLHMLFSPVFFAYIGINAKFSGINGTALLFALAFVGVGILGKIIGSGGMARVSRYTRRESLIVGIGMIARGEVALVVLTKGLENGVFAAAESAHLASAIQLSVILLVIVTSLIAPVLLKLLFKNYHNDPLPPVMLDGTIAPTAPTPAPAAECCTTTSE